MPKPPSNPFNSLSTECKVKKGRSYSGAFSFLLPFMPHIDTPQFLIILQPYLHPQMFVQQVHPRTQGNPQTIIGEAHRKGQINLFAVHDPF